MTQKARIAIVGAGLVGSGWAVVFARAGHPVVIYDPSPAIREDVQEWARTALDELARTGLVTDPGQALSLISVTDDLATAVSAASYVQESVYETVEAKTRASREIDAALSPGAIVGSSSSGIPASQFTQDCVNRDRFLIAHPVNPPHLVPVVELVPAPWTASDALVEARELMASVGQVPVTVRMEVDGFILNRLQGALLNEAWALYAEGYASLEDIDATVSQGLGLRWSFMGPFETIDLNAPSGISDYAARLGGLYYGMALSRCDPKPWSPDVISNADAERRAVLPAEHLAERRAWRDAHLVRLAAFKKSNGLVSAGSTGTADTGQDMPTANSPSGGIS